MSRLKITPRREQTNVAERGGNSNLTPFAPGNKAAVGHSGPGWIAQVKVAMLDCVKPEDFALMLLAQVEKALDGDTAAFLAVRDTMGLKPKDEVVSAPNQTLFELLGITSLPGAPAASG